MSRIELVSTRIELDRLYTRYMSAMGLVYVYMSGAYKRGYAVCLRLLYMSPHNNIYVLIPLYI
jgi:hypothetical protein